MKLILIFLILNSFACKELNHETENIISKNQSGRINTVDEDLKKIVENNKFEYKGYSFEVINEENGDCILNYKKDKTTSVKKLKIDVPLPCAVVRENTNEHPLGNRIANLSGGKSDSGVFMIAGNIKKADKGCLYKTDNAQIIQVRKNGIKNLKYPDNNCIPGFAEPAMWSQAWEKKPQK